MSERVRIPARGDGHAIAAELFLPDGPPKACALIAGAMAVRGKFYAPIAGYLSRQGCAALTLDYRGVGASRPDGSLRGFPATFHDWGERDLGGAVDFLARRFARLPLLWVGHSAGAQLMGLVPDAQVAAALFVASGTAYWRKFHGRSRAFLTALFFAGIPALVPIAGYMPSAILGGGDDLPAGVGLEWARWARDPRYVFSYAEPRGGLGFTRYAGPLLSVGFDDDSYAPKEAVAHLLSLYTAARKEHRRVAAGPEPIGHFGFFRRRELWEEPVRWLLSRSGVA